MYNKIKVEKYFLWTVIILTLFGFLIFYSASTGLAAKENLNFYSRIINQFTIGILGGLFLMFIFYKIINNDFIKKHAIILFLISFTLNLVVFIPGVGIEHGGSIRWIDFKFFTLQPSELLKITSIIFFASWINYHKEKIKKNFFSIISLCVLILLISIPLIFQRDFDTIFLITVPICAMYLVAKAPFKHFLLFLSLPIILGLILFFTVPHINSRIMGFLNQSEDGQTINYQTQQSQIAIGSGGIFGKGLGKSTQKFGALPEPTSDSVFAVLAEETGLIGATFILILYLLLIVFGYKIALNSKNIYGSLFTFGVMTLIATQSIMNIASMVGLFPITGQPLVFVSHGGTSLLVTLASMGMILNISKKEK